MKRFTVLTLLLSLLAVPSHAANIVMGTNGHNAWVGGAYRQADEEKLFQLMRDRNIRSYRIDIDGTPPSIEALTRVVNLGKKHDIIIRPMLYVDNNPEQLAYDIAKKYGSDIKVFELGNELNLRGIADFDVNIQNMIAARRGIDRASKETGQTLKTTLNVAAFLGGIGLNNALTSYPFIDRSIQLGLKFDYISFHFYPQANDMTDGWVEIYFNPLRQYGKPVLFNETNCAQIYSGDDGNSQACADTFSALIARIKNHHSDLVAEFNSYELLDSTTQAGAEAHFGMMFDADTPKRTLDVLTNHATGTSIASQYPDLNLNPSTEDYAIRGLYLGILNREPNFSESNDWEKIIKSKRMSKTAVVAYFVSSPEFKNSTKKLTDDAFVNRAFRAILGRSPDAKSFALYKGQLKKKGGSNRDRVIQQMLASDEFKRRKL